MTATTPVEFLRELWGETPPGVIQCWRLSDKRSAYLDAPEQAAGFEGKRDLYTRVATVVPPLPPHPKRGGEDASHALAGFFLDRDLKGEDKPRGFESIEEAISLARRHAEPSIVVASGHGIQPWYLFEEPLDLDGNREHVKQVLAALAGASGFLILRHR